MPRQQAYYLDGAQPEESLYSRIEQPYTAKKIIARANAVMWLFAQPVGARAQVWRADPGYPKLIYELEHLPEGVGLTFFVPKRFDAKSPHLLI